MIGYVESEPALVIDDFLIISDLHIGFEEELKKEGYNVPWQTKNFVKKIKNLKQRTRCAKLIILGDVKHSISLFPRMELQVFFNMIAEIFNEIIIVKGNHDGLIERITENYANISVVPEFLYKDYLFIHGHKKTKLLDKAKVLLIGHFHSMYMFKDVLGRNARKPSWKIFDFKDKNIKVISFPSFNDYFSGGSKTGPYSKYLELKEVLTLDLVKLV